jgi:hypothetical protein
LASRSYPPAAAKPAPCGTRDLALDAERAAAATAIAKLGNAGFLNLSQSVVPPERSDPIAQCDGPRPRSRGAGEAEMAEPARPGRDSFPVRPVLLATSRLSPPDEWQHLSCRQPAFRGGEKVRRPCVECCAFLLCPIVLNPDYASSASAQMVQHRLGDFEAHAEAL